MGPCLGVRRAAYQRLFSGTSISEETFETLPRRRRKRGLLPSEHHFKFTRPLKDFEVVKSANKVGSDDDLGDATSASCCSSKSALGFEVALQTPFLIQHTMPIEQHFRLHASTATSPCPNHNAWLLILNHGFPFNREGFKIGFCPGFRPLGSLGRTAEV